MGRRARPHKPLLKASGTSTVSASLCARPAEGEGAEGRGVGGGESGKSSPGGLGLAGTKETKIESRVSRPG